MAPEGCLCLPIFRTGMCQGAISLWLSKTKVGWAAVGTELIFIHSKVSVKHHKIVLKTQVGLFCAQSEWFPWHYGRNSATDVL